jgi:hypothetical protein
LLTESGLKNTSFSRRLSSPVHLSKASRLRGETVTSRQVASSTFDIERCQFTGISEADEPGGAVRSTDAVRVVNTLFRNCQGKSGGVISSISALSLYFTTFEECRAEQGVAMDLRTEDSHSCDAILTLVTDVSPELFGAIYRQARGEFYTMSSNLTRPRGDKCVGCMEAKFGSMAMKYCVLTESSADSHNGGVCCRDFESLAIDCCFFDRCRHTLNEEVASAPPKGIDYLFADPMGCPVGGAARARPHKKRFNRKEWIIKKNAMQRKLGQKVANDSKYTGRSRRRWI